MSNELVVVERQLQTLAPRFEQVLNRIVPVGRLVQTIVVSCERNPTLLRCDRQSLINSAMSAAVLGLEVDGVTGQAFLIPFNDNRNNRQLAQLVVGYKGYNTIGARSGLTITGESVYENDNFDYDLGEGWVKHKPAGQNRGRLIYAWAKAAHNDRPPIVKVLSIDEILAIKARSPGARRKESPWNDQVIGFPAMAEKSAKRRLARSLPLNTMQLAARMEEAFDEQGVPAYLDPAKGVVIDGQIEPNPTPTFEQLTGDKGVAPASEEEGGGEIQPSPPPSEQQLEEQRERLMAAARQGMTELFEAWQKTPRDCVESLRPFLNDRLKPIAEQVSQQ